MSDCSLTLVPATSIYPLPRQRAATLVNWLMAEQVISSIASRCTLGSQPGYAPAAGAAAVSARPHLLPYGLAVNGLRIIIGRQVFDTGSLALTVVRCPACLHNLVDKEWDLGPWDNQASALLTCLQCHTAADIQAYTFEPAWGFSNLGFRF